MFIQLVAVAPIAQARALEGHNDPIPNPISFSSECHSKKKLPLVRRAHRDWYLADCRGQGLQGTANKYRSLSCPPIASRHPDVDLSNKRNVEKDVR